GEAERAPTRDLVVEDARVIGERDTRRARHAGKGRRRAFRGPTAKRPVRGNDAPLDAQEGIVIGERDVVRLRGAGDRNEGDVAGVVRIATRNRTALEHDTYASVHYRAPLRMHARDRVDARALRARGPAPRRP